MKIKIGADELILWIRKNHIADDIPNGGNGGLGQDIIYKYITELGGNKIVDNQESFWDIRNDSKNISDNLLPKTSAQYEIEISKLPELFEKLMELKQKTGT